MIANSKAGVGRLHGNADQENHGLDDNSMPMNRQDWTRRCQQCFQTPKAEFTPVSRRHQRPGDWSGNMIRTALALAVIMMLSSTPVLDSALTIFHDNDGESKLHVGMLEVEFDADGLDDGELI
tara:strand:- start:30 stop:398 length:369 start_codon:yes stop_codon:yes gene_type:complete